MAREKYGYFFRYIKNFEEQTKAMFILKDFKIKKEWETNSKKFLTYIFYMCILLGIADYFIMKNSFLLCFSKFMIYFFGISYCILGYKKYYKVIKSICSTIDKTADNHLSVYSI